MRVERFLFAHAQRDPQRTAVICGPRRITYAELAGFARAEADRLARAGVRPGDRVAIHLPNGVEFVERACAAWAAGAAVVPVNTRLAAPEVEHILADARPAVVFDREGEMFHAARDPRGDPEDCLILYTSGTTGRPKGVVNTHANMIVQNVYQHAIAWGVGRDDVYLATTPLAQRAGMGRVFGALGLGGTLVLMEKFDPGAVLELIERERVSVAGLPPTVIRLMLPHLRESPGRAAALRTVIVATEAFPASLLEEVAALLPAAAFHAVYGLSEAVVTSVDRAEQLAHPGTVGRPLPGVEVMIADEAGNEVPEGAVGEILVRGGRPGQDAVMKGYFNRPDANAEAFRNGWFRTGDLGRRDAGGYLYVVDRLKDMIVTGGYNVYCKELERVLVQHPAVADAAVVGAPDPIYGESVAAFIELRQGARLSADEVVEHCLARLASYKKPRRILFVDRLPRNSVGKVLKHELRKRLQ
jgi:long-chain acyl-CoA synthetase